MAEFDQVQRRIRACRLCVDQGFIPAAHPVLFGSTSAQVMVLGQAPGPTATERPLPYSGASGKTLQAWLQRAGFDEEALHDPKRFYLTSTTKCFPGRSKSGKGDRSPSRREIDFCSRHLDIELKWVRPELIPALGRLSIGTMLPSLRRKQLVTIIGSAYPVEYRAAGRAQVLPLPHPSGVSRWLNEPPNQARLSVALDWLDVNRRNRSW